MEQHSLVNGKELKEACAGSTCLNCRECKVINIEEGRREIKNQIPQLYAKEAEHYFFYYRMNFKQV